MLTNLLFNSLPASVKQYRQTIVVGLVCLVVGGAIGRFEAPTKVVTTTQQHTVQQDATQQQVDTQVQRHDNKVYTRVETDAPDGTKRIETKIADQDSTTVDRDATTAKTDSTVQDNKTEKTVERQSGGLLIYGIAGAQLNNWGQGPELGAGVQRRMLGPLWLGCYGTNRLNAGVTLGLSF